MDKSSSHSPLESDDRNLGVGKIQPIKLIGIDEFIIVFFSHDTPLSFISVGLLP